MSEITTEAILKHLRALVAADSSDPAATVTPDHPVVTHCVRALEVAGCGVWVNNLGGGCVNILAKRGETRTLFNCHLDTVKPNPSWTRNPFSLTVENGKAFGLGACDIKGAAACMLAAAEATDEPIAILFTTDEEGGKGVCVNSFVNAQSTMKSGNWERVVVAEPTGASAVLQHRGFASFEVRFTGTAGHTSGDGAADSSAVHRAVLWASRALELAEPFGPLDGARFNIGIVNGGTASNVVAAETTVRFGFRPEPASNAAEETASRVGLLRGMLPEGAEWTDRFLAPPLTADHTMAEAVEAWGIDAGPDVDFWTEAALFAAAGLPAIVLGPGNIAQAHAADEFVELSQLDACAAVYVSIIRAGDDAVRRAGLAHSGGQTEGREHAS